MYQFLHELLADKTGGEIFQLFSLSHFFYIVITAAMIISTLLLCKNKSYETKRKASKIFIYIAFGLYMADFFLMPFAYGRIDIEKLPFHACTAMCIMCFASNHNKFLEKYRTSIAMLGLIANITYLLYPAGVMWYSIHPTSYRAVQTLLFHSFMVVYTILTLVYEREKIEIKKCYRDLVVILIMTAWAIIGSYCYTADVEGYSYFFNWFFVLQDPFGIIPRDIATVLMPVLDIVVFFAAEMIIHLIIAYSKKKARKNCIADA